MVNVTFKMNFPRFFVSFFFFFLVFALHVHSEQIQQVKFEAEPVNNLIWAVTDNVL